MQKGDSLYIGCGHFGARLGIEMQPTADISCLTPLEREIFELVGQGFRDWHIDETFWMTRQTLSVHLGSIFHKLGVADQTELAQLAARLTPVPVRR